MDNRIRFSAEIFASLLAGYEIDKESGEVVLTDFASEMLRLTVDGQKIPKSSTSSRKEKKEINEKTDIEILYHVKRNPNIAISKLSLDLGYSINALRNNEHTRTLFERYQKMFITQPKVDNDPYANRND